MKRNMAQRSGVQGEDEDLEELVLSDADVLESETSSSEDWEAGDDVGLQLGNVCDGNEIKLEVRARG